MASFKETLIIAVGGSLLVPGKIDVNFLSNLKHMICNLIDQNYQVILVPGGGKTARIYQEALQSLDITSHDALDMIGIKAIHMNCELIKYLFSNITDQTLIYEPHELEGLNTSLIIKAAFKPGNSSDMGAVRMAKISGAQRIINFSNTDHVYDKDPNKYDDAVRFDRLSWNEYRELVPTEWTPGMSAPFDPVASEKAQQLGMTVAVLGASIQNLENYLKDEKFEGTIIK